MIDFKFSNPILPVFLILIICTAIAQGQSSEIQDEQYNDFEIVLPPLSALIDSAMQYSPMVKYREHEMNSRMYNVQSQKNYWIRNFGVQADLRYGTFDIFTSSVTDGQNPYLYSTRSNQLNYGVGAFIKFPFYDFVNRKNQVKQAVAELNQASSMADAQRLELRQSVITQYNEVLLKQRLLKIKSRNLGNARINMDMVEAEFKNGLIPVSEYARISEIASSSESDFESARSELITAIMILEEMVGFKINVSNRTEK